MKPKYPKKHEPLKHHIKEVKALNAYTYDLTIEHRDSSTVVVNGEPLLDLVSSDYLDLTAHPKVKQAAIDAIRQFGTGASGSPIINGNTSLHKALERKLAKFHRTETAMIFASGNQTNVGTIPAVVSRGDVVIVDKLVHASIIDGCKLSRADIRAFPHNDMGKLERILQQSEHYETKLIVADSLYSMDGDLADLPAICTLAEKHDAYLMVDEAHATGVLGKNGAGAVEHFGLEGKVDIIMGVLSKALASVGGFVCASHELIEIFSHAARSYLFSTALPPSVVAASIAALDAIQSEPYRREKLWQNTTQFKNGLDKLGFNTINSVTPIIPILIGDDLTALQMAKLLQQSGILLSAIIFPAVPRGRARMRVRVSAAHTPEEIHHALEKIAKIGDRLGII